MPPAQHAAIDRLNGEHGFRVFKGIESDILADGALRPWASECAVESRPAMRLAPGARQPVEAR
jgi:hypothetical protein